MYKLLGWPLPLLEGRELTDSIVNTAQSILREQFPDVCGFQSTLKGYRLEFSSVGCEAIQIFYVAGECIYIVVV